MSCGWLNNDNTKFCVKCNAAINEAGAPVISVDSGNRTGESLNQPKENLMTTLRETPTVREETQHQKQNTGNSLGVHSFRSIRDFNNQSENPNSSIRQFNDIPSSIREISSNGPISNPGNCSKCNYPLAMGSTECPMCHAPIQVTKQIQTPSQSTKTNNNCPHCNYPLSTEATECPRCREKINPLASIRLLNDDKDVKEVKKPTPISSGTIRNFGLLDEDENDKQEQIGTCQLTILTPNGDGESIELSEKENILNRNTSILQNNQTISQEKHAVLSQENGDWFIEDHSSTKRTFVIVREKTRLEDGDIIILGNKFIEFKKK